MLQVDVLLLLLTTVVLICSVVARAPKPFRDPPRHVLICCAHSDDCIITGAEYAYGAVQGGLSVRVAYLTCSASSSDSEIARIRKAEALAAWSALGVPKEHFTFIDLSESPVEGPVSYSDQDLAYAKDVFKTLILSLPPNAALIVPADGESHVDHRTVRKLSLQALVDTRREDIAAYETPEYNSFLSLVHCPKRAIRAVLSRMPLLNRVVKSYVGPSNYVNGVPGFIFRDTPKRLAKKKELLRYFTSQNGDELVRSFGYETLYRQVSLPERCHRSTWCVSAFEGCCDLSVFALAISVLAMGFLTAHQAARGLTIALLPLPIANFLPLLGGLLASVYVIRRIRGTVNLETSLFVWTVSFGLLLGAL